MVKLVELCQNILGLNLKPPIKQLKLRQKPVQKCKNKKRKVTGPIVYSKLKQWNLMT